MICQQQQQDSIVLLLPQRKSKKKMMTILPLGHSSSPFLTRTPPTRVVTITRKTTSGAPQQHCR